MRKPKSITVRCPKCKTKFKRPAAKREPCAICGKVVEMTPYDARKETGFNKKKHL